MNYFDTTLELLKESPNSISDDLIYDLEEDYDLKCGKKFIAQALLIVKQFPQKFTEKDAIKWCKAAYGKGEIPKEVEGFLRDEKWNKDEAKFNKAKDKESKPKKPKMTRKQYEKRCKDACKDWLADNDGYEGEDAFYDLADGLLYDPDFLAYCEYEFGKAQGRKVSRQTIKEIVADEIASNR